jgi:hypothetical protein
MWRSYGKPLLERWLAGGRYDRFTMLLYTIAAFAAGVVLMLVAHFSDREDGP